AIDAYNLGYKIEIIASAVASLTEERHQFALRHAEQVLGADIR
ncbi:isochorismatase family protein, partial [Gemella sp. 19428wG2_WT2a]